MKFFLNLKIQTKLMVTTLSILIIGMLIVFLTSLNIALNMTKEASLNEARSYIKILNLHFEEQTESLIKSNSLIYLRNQRKTRSKYDASFQFDYNFYNQSKSLYFLEILVCFFY